VVGRAREASRLDDLGEARYGLESVDRLLHFTQLSFAQCAVYPEIVNAHNDLVASPGRTNEKST
jgi:hypothetical protein